MWNQKPLSACQEAQIPPIPISNTRFFLLWFFTFNMLKVIFLLLEKKNAILNPSQ